MPDLFWGRFRKSAWFVIFAAGGYGAAAGDAQRTWGTYNLLVRFDSDGNVKTSEIVQDKELVEHLVAMSRDKEFPALDLAEPVGVGGPVVSINARVGTSVDFQLSDNAVVVTRRRPAGLHIKPHPPLVEVISVPLSEISRIRVDGYSDQANEIPVTVHFSHKTKLGNHITFTTPPSTVLALVRWQQEAKADP